MKRSYLDALVEGILVHVFSLRCLLAPEVTPELVIPLACCMTYEFLFDYGQHMHTYATQNLHLVVCMCFPVAQGQVVGMQLFLTLLYIGSGFCKLGPTFPHMFTMNLASAKFMVGVPWARWFRRLTFKAHDAEPPDFGKTAFAWWLANGAAMVEFSVPFLLYTRNSLAVALSIFTFQCMHVFIIATLIIDVFCWNFTGRPPHLQAHRIIEHHSSSGSLLSSRCGGLLRAVRPALHGHRPRGAAGHGLCLPRHFGCIASASRR